MGNEVGSTTTVTSSSRATSTTNNSNNDTRTSISINIGSLFGSGTTEGDVVIKVSEKERALAEENAEMEARVKELKSQSDTKDAELAELRKKLAAAEQELKTTTEGLKVSTETAKELKDKVFVLESQNRAIAKSRAIEEVDKLSEQFRSSVFLNSVSKDLKIKIEIPKQSSLLPSNFEDPKVLEDFITKLNKEETKIGNNLIPTSLESKVDQIFSQAKPGSKFAKTLEALELKAQQDYQAKLLQYEADLAAFNNSRRMMYGGTIQRPEGLVKPEKPDNMPSKLFEKARSIERKRKSSVMYRVATKPIPKQLYQVKPQRTFLQIINPFDGK